MTVLESPGSGSQGMRAERLRNWLESEEVSGERLNTIVSENGSHSLRFLLCWSTHYKRVHEWNRKWTREKPCIGLFLDVLLMLVVVVAPTAAAAGASATHPSTKWRHAECGR